MVLPAPPVQCRGAWKAGPPARDVARRCLLHSQHVRVPGNQKTRVVSTGTFLDVVRQQKDTGSLSGDGG